MIQYVMLTTVICSVSVLSIIHNVLLTQILADTVCTVLSM